MDKIDDEKLFFKLIRVFLQIELSEGPGRVETEGFSGECTETRGREGGVGLERKGDLSVPPQWSTQRTCDKDMVLLDLLVLK